MPSTPIKQAQMRQIAIQPMPIIVAYGISFVDLIDIKRTKICGCPKYPSPQARAEIILIIPTPSPIDRASGFILAMTSIASLKPPR